MKIRNYKIKKKNASELYIEISKQTKSFRSVSSFSSSLDDEEEIHLYYPSPEGFYNELSDGEKVPSCTDKMRKDSRMLFGMCVGKKRKMFESFYMKRNYKQTGWLGFILDKESKYEDVKRFVVDKDCKGDRRVNCVLIDKGEIVDSEAVIDNSENNFIIELFRLKQTDLNLSIDSHIVNVFLMSLSSVSYVQINKTDVFWTLKSIITKETKIRESI
jgi:hypothetical protein